MAYRPIGKARIDPLDPRAFAICQRCDQLYNAYALNWQNQWIGNKLQNKRVQVCPQCMDKPSEFLRQLVLPPDPLAINQPRQENYFIDEQGGVAVPNYFSAPGSVIQVSVPSWATGFFTECYGSGAGGSILNGSFPNMGGGGGAFARSAKVLVAGGSSVWVYVAPAGGPGVAGADTWVSTANAAPTSAAGGCLAKGGQTPDLLTLPLPTVGLGGQASACIGDVAFSGGNGGLAAVGPANVGGTGGGGAAGPNGPGGNAADTTVSLNGTAGGMANGAHGVGTGGQPGQGTTATVAKAPDQQGLNGMTDSVYGMAGGPGGGGGAGGGGANVSVAGIGGDGGAYGGGGGGGGYGAATNGVGGSGGHGFVMLRWLQ
jgi:hypothetical protein